MKRFKAYPDLTLDEEPVTKAPRLVIIKGRAVLRGGVGVTYDKSLSVVSGGSTSPLWMTKTYRYNAHVIGRAPLMRYDNGNGDKHYPDHPTAHHKHEFDWRATATTSRPVHLPGFPLHTGMDYPTLAAFLDEVCDWVRENRHTLPHPEWMPDIDEVQLSYG